MMGEIKMNSLTKQIIAGERTPPNVGSSVKKIDYNVLDLRLRYLDILERLLNKCDNPKVVIDRIGILMIRIDNDLLGDPERNEGE